MNPIGIIGALDGTTHKLVTEPMDLRHFLDPDQIIASSTIADGLGIPLVNRFACLLNAPSLVSAQNGWLEFQVLSVDCPGIAIETNAIELNGVQRYNFKGRSYDDLQITFMETSELTLRDFFYQWMKLAVEPSKTGGVRRHYFNDVKATDFVIAPLDYEGKARRCDRFMGVFPTRVQDVNYNYATNGEFVKTTVTFKYMFHIIDTINSDKDGKHLSTQTN